MLVEGRYITMTSLNSCYVPFLQLPCYCFGIGIPEDLPDKLRSILAQAEYAYRIREWDAKGVPFRFHAYVPECDPITKEEFHEREDHAHLLKVFNMIMLTSNTAN